MQLISKHRQSIVMRKTGENRFKLANFLKLQHKEASPTKEIEVKNGKPHLMVRKTLLNNRPPLLNLFKGLGTAQQRRQSVEEHNDFSAI